MTLLIGLLIGLGVAYIALRLRPKKSKPATGESDTIRLLRRQIADAATAAEVEGDILAVCAARGWEIENTYNRRLRSGCMIFESGDDEYVRIKDWWTVGGYSAPSLAEAWDMACAHRDASEKVKAKHQKDEAA